MVSHAAAAEANQHFYVALQDLGWTVHLVIPGRWVDGFDGHPVETTVVSALRPNGTRLPVVLAGRQQRHVYLARVGAIVRNARPAIAFIEEEPFSASAWQWSAALHKAGVPFAVQSDENLSRPLPFLARAFRRAVLARVAFVAARSPRAADLISEVRTELIPHAFVAWDASPPPPREGSFVVGYAGRLVEQKGLRDLLAAVERLGGVRLLVVGDGELRHEVQAAATRTGRIELLTNIRHDMMQTAYARMHVLVLPSRTTATWAEQFGRVLVEALWSGIPVVGSSSGEIPWVVKTTGGGIVFPEGDVDALARALVELRDDPTRCDRFASAGRAAVASLFSVPAVAGTMDRVLTEFAI